MGSKMKSRIEPARSMRQRRGKYLNDTASDARRRSEKVQKSYRLLPSADENPVARPGFLHTSLSPGAATRIGAKEE